jgi:hypothetical protein
MTRWTLIPLAAAVALASCKSKVTPAEGDPQTAPAAPASQAERAAPGAAATPGTPAPRPLAFEGSYEAQAGTMFIPREGDVPNAAEWAGTKFRSDDAGVGRGAGTLALSIDADGRISGEGSGALGAFTLTGQRTGDRARGTLRGGAPDFFFGTFDLTIAGDAATGTASASDGEARVVRTLTVTLRAK